MRVFKKDILLNKNDTRVSLTDWEREDIWRITWRI